MHPNRRLRGRLLDPEGVEEVTAMLVDPMEVLVTPFNSWRGVANPAAPFNNELGNRIHFGLSILGDGDLISLTDALGNGRVDFELEWQDKLSGMPSTSTLVTNPLLTGSFNARSYDGSFVGVTYDNSLDRSGGITLLSSGESGDTLVNEIHYVGVGDGLAVPQLMGATNQESIDTFLIKYRAPDNPQQQLCASYTFEPDGGLAQTIETCVMFVPEPSGFLMLISAALMASLGRRQQSA